jgi:predicted nuclease with TOPRIM domain
MAATTADLVNEFIELDEQRKGKEGEVEKIKERMAELEPEIMKRFENAGMQSMKSKMGRTIYIRRELWASAAEGAEVLLLETLKAIGLGDMVKEKINTQTLSAYVREVEKDSFNGQAVDPVELIKVLPDQLQPALKVTQKFSLRTRK